MLLSIITINYNNCDGLYQTICSVQDQVSNTNNFEFIVVDGGSSDGSQNIIEKSSNIITRYVSERDNGIYNAMNKGVKMANGDYVLFLNSGDTLADNDTIDNINQLISHTFDDIIIGSVNTMKDGFFVTKRHTVTNKITLFNLFLTGIPHQGTLTKRQLLLDNPFDETYRINSDFKFFLQTIILQNCSVKYIPELIISNYDLGGISSTNKELQFTERRRIYEELIPERIREDYDKVFPYYYEAIRVSWLLKHPFFYRIYRVWCSIGRKLLGNDD